MKKKNEEGMNWTREGKAVTEAKRLGWWQKDKEDEKLAIKAFAKSEGVQLPYPQTEKYNKEA